MIIWFIGLSGSGKTYLSDLLYEKIKLIKKNTFLMDGDNFREAMGHDLGYTREDRYKNGWRIASFSKMLNAQNINVIVPILSIFHEHQSYLQKNTKNYIQIYVKSDINEIEKRDVKGVYKKDKNVVGRDIFFPEPINSNYVFDNKFCEKKAQYFIDNLFGDIQIYLD